MMNNSYAYQYSCSPDTEPEHQIVNDVSRKPTEPLGQQNMQGQQETHYTYGFEEFENRTLFKRILKNILSPGPYSTMAAIIDMRAVDIDQHTYIGVHAIAVQAAKSERQVERDLKYLEDRGLLRTFPDMALVKGTMRAVIRKDFSALYKFAKEYLDWEKSPGFAMYPPKRKFAELIKTNRELYKKLVRFENYRLILDTEKNKFKKADESQNVMDNEDTNISLGEIRNKRYLLCDSSLTVSSMSPYESHKLLIDSIEDSNLTQEKNLIQEDSPLPWRDEGYPRDEGGTHSEDFELECGKGSEEYSFEIPPAPQGNISQKETEPSVKRNVPRNVKEPTAKEKSNTFISEVLNESDRKKDASAKERYNKWAEAEELRRENRSLANLMSHVVDEFNQPENSKRSMVTFVLNLFKSSQMTFDEFTELLYYVRAEIQAKPDSAFRARYLGKANEAPLFYCMMRDGVEKGMQYLIDEKARRAKIEAIGQEPAVEIEQDVVDAVVETFIRPAAEASHRAQQELASYAPDPQTITQQEFFTRAEQRHKAAYELAKEQIGQIVPTPVTLQVTSILPCGCPVAVRKGLSLECAVCRPQSDWSEQVCTQVKEVVASIPTQDQCDELEYEHCLAQGIVVMQEAV